MSTRSPSPGRHEIDWLAPATREILDLAQREVEIIHKHRIYPEHLLVGLITQGTSAAANVFLQLGLYSWVLREKIEQVHGIAAEPHNSSPSITFSQEALDCIALAVELVSGYTTKQQETMHVTPEHLALSILQHPRLRAAFPSTTLHSLRASLTNGMSPDFVSYMKEFFRSPEEMRKKRSSVMHVILLPDKQPSHGPAQQKSLPTCPSCYRTVQPQWKHCVYCRARLQKRCSNCGTPYPTVPGAKYCSECGHTLR